jgi:hypothetical protein
MASSSLLKEPHDHAAESERQNLNKQHRTSTRVPIPRSGFVHGAGSGMAGLGAFLKNCGLSGS